MNDAEFEQLLYEEESNTLDFKREQYLFAKSSDNEKSELLKDILGFSNALRRSVALILIGVDDVRGGRANVVGISAMEHLDDHSLQQFVNGRTNRPVNFRYEAFGFEGKQVGIIHIEQQARPIFLVKDYGRLKQHLVYVRRGSSTDPTKPAEPDEIARMGGNPSTTGEARLSVEFSDPNREIGWGDRIVWTGEYCQMPAPDDIPSVYEPSESITLPGGNKFTIPSLSSMRVGAQFNSNFLRHLAFFISAQRLVRTIRLVITNTGDVPAADVRLEICIDSGQGFGILDPSEIPESPKRHEDVFSRISSVVRKPRHSGTVEIDKNSHRSRIEIDCGNIQPGRSIWTDIIHLAIAHTGEVKLTGTVFAANLPQPMGFSLWIDATITQTSMTVEELEVLGHSFD